MTQANNQNQGNKEQYPEDNKVFARHVQFKDTKTGGSIVTMFFSQEEAKQIASDLEAALSTPDSEGAKISVVTGEGKNGKPYALVGASPLYPSKNGNAYQAQAQTQAPTPAKTGYQPRTNNAPQAQRSPTGFKSKRL